MYLVVLTSLLTLGCGRLDFGGQAVDGGLDATPPLDLSGLIARFSFETPAGAVVVDSVHQNSGSCAESECPTLVAGHRGNAYQFDGINDCIVVPDVGQLDPPQFTLSLWVRQDVDGPMTPLSKRFSGGGNTWQVESMTNEVMYFTTRSATGPDRLVSAAGAGQLGQWQLATATWDGMTKVLYLDGARVATGTSELLVSDANAAQIGCDDNAPINNWFSGAIDEVEIYDRALDPDEVSLLATR